MTLAPRRAAGAVLRAVALLLAALAPAAHAASHAAGDQARSRPQIDWQRNLDDARALAYATGRPLLVAVNVDGESSSERIVVERYRDERFAAAASRFVCVLGSPVRHNLRDHDAAGRRIECPRFGQVTCGEHVALEPAIFDAYLAEPRVSPRHALILPDGTKAFDLYYLFDMRELDAALEQQAAGLAPLSLPDPAVPGLETGDLRAWRILCGMKHAAARAHAGAAFLELPSDEARRRALRAASDCDPDTTLDLAVLAACGGPDAERALLHEAAHRVRVAQRLPEWCALVRGSLSSLDVRGGPQAAAGAALHADDATSVQLIELLAACAADDPATRTWILGVAACGTPSQRAAVRTGWSRAQGEESWAELDRAMAAEGGPLDASVLHVAARLWACMDLPAPVVDALPPPADAALELAAADEALRDAPLDPAAMDRFARACMEAAQQQMQRGIAGADLLLQDARAWFERAAALGSQQPRRAWDRARVAYLLGDHAEEERVAAEGLRAVVPADDPRARRMSRWLAPHAATVEGAAAVAGVLRAEDRQRAEGLRWLGDAGLRLGAARARGPAAEELSGMLRTLRALAEVACSSGGGEPDWLAYASALRIWCGPRASLVALKPALARLPASDALRGALHECVAALGRPEAGWEVALRTEGLHPDDGVSAWYAGASAMRLAEHCRRRLDVAGALDAYSAAAAAYGRAERVPWVAASSRAWQANARLGAAHALLLARREQEAADQLLEALSIGLYALDARDGLDRDLPDCVDGIFEWRQGRPSSVDGEEFARRVSSALVDDAAAARVLAMVADALLREALRDDGREGAVAVFEQILRAEEDAAARIAVVEGRVPTAAGDALLGHGIAVARLALARSADEPSRRLLAQLLSVQAQRLWSRGDLQPAGPPAAEARALLGLAPAAPEALRESLHELRDLLGAARPAPRPGR